MTEGKQKGERPARDTGEAGLTAKKEHEPHRLNIPGFIKEEIGLGDAIKRVTSAVGIKPCQGCQRRAAALNRWLVFSPRHRK
jgi:hypothetical protein